MKWTRSRAVRAVGCTGVLAALALAGVAVPAGASPGAVARPRTELLSSTPAGAPGAGRSYAGALSPGGRYAVFDSEAADLVPGDTNGTQDVFVRDLSTGLVERVSVASDGGQAGGYSISGGISADGRFVTFSSEADNLVPGDTNGAEDVFVRDRRTGRTERISTGDPAQPQTGGSGSPVISWDGRYVAYDSGRADLVPGDTNQVADVFVFDRRTGATRRASVGVGGAEADRASVNPVLSSDGSRVGFTSKAGNLLPGGPATPAARAGGDGPGTGPAARAAAEGPGITKPQTYPYYVHDLRTGRTEGGSLGSDGVLASANAGYLSPDGRRVVFTTRSSDIVPGDTNGLLDVFVRDLATGTTRLVSSAQDGTASNGMSYDPVITADGRSVFFTSEADSLVPGDTNAVSDVFRRDLVTGRVERVSVAADGGQTAGASSGPSVDALGAVVVFGSEDGTLAAGDTNGAPDAFARRL